MKLKDAMVRSLHIPMYKRPEYGNWLLLCTVSLKIETELLKYDVCLRYDPANVAQFSTYRQEFCQHDSRVQYRFNVALTLRDLQIE